MEQQTSVFRKTAATTREPDAPGPIDWRVTLWLALLVIASVAFSLGFACAVPFAALGAGAALILTRRLALLVAGAAWLANQIVGFAFLNYPWTKTTFVWGVVLGAVAILSTATAQTIVSRIGERPPAVIALAAFGGAFIAYEGALFVISAGLLGGTENFVPEIVARIFEINAAAFVGLLVLNRIAIAVGVAVKPGFSYSLADRPAVSKPLEV